MRRGFRILAAAAAVVNTGCFSYVQAPMESVPPGENVRVMLSRQGRVELPEHLEIDDAYVAGRLMRREAERVFLNVPIAQVQQGFHLSAIEQEVGIRTSEIVEFELRRLDKAKTGLFVAGTAAAAALVVYVIIEAGARPSDRPGPGPDEFRIPLISIPVR